MSQNKSGFVSIFTIIITLMILTAIYYIFFDPTPKSTGNDLDEPPSWCSGIYCD